MGGHEYLKGQDIMMLESTKKFRKNRLLSEIFYSKRLEFTLYIMWS